jgi:hypothetical protein
MGLHRNVMSQPETLFLRVSFLTFFDPAGGNGCFLTLGFPFSHTMGQRRGNDEAITPEGVKGIKALLRSSCNQTPVLKGINDSANFLGGFVHPL